MAQGLDELIEWLVGEVAFYGDGCAISDLFASVRKYGKDDEAADDGGNNAAAAEAAAKAALTDAELRLGRLIWSHIVDTGDVSVGVSGKWNHLTFDEMVSLPEETAEGSGAPIKDIKARLNDRQPVQNGNAAAEKPPKPIKLPKIRPRLFVGEETVWKTLTGHGIDFKRIPPLEWKLVVCIGSTKEVGISQPDLVRATGQDKRSVPRRTDFLSYKGYIVKRTHMVRGMKTSKLWLTKLAPELPAPTDPLKGLDMSKDILTRDMEPVPWFHQWVGNKTVKGKEELAYTALVQTIVAVIKAWGTLRLRDLKLKLGVIGLKWQMKIVSKFLRRANERGNLAYTAAQFSGNNVIFKDCIKFMREPTEDDWRVLLATGVRSRPSYNKQTGKKIKRKSKGKGRARSNIKPKQMVRTLKKRFRHPPSPAVAQWTPEKPFANTLADYVLTGGKEGYTTTEVSHALVGPEFYRYMHKFMSTMCKPDNQPPRLSEYEMSSELTRSGSVQAYAFSCAGAAPSHQSEDIQGESAIDPALAQESMEKPDCSAAFGFGPVDHNVFIKNGPTDLASLVQILPIKKVIKPNRAYNRRKEQDPDMAVDGTSPQPPAPKRGRPRKPRKEPTEDENAEVAPAASAPAASGRRGRKRKAAQRVSYVDDLDRLIDGSDTGSDGEPRPKRSTTEMVQPTDAGEQSGAETVKSVKTLGSEEREESEESEKIPDRSLPGVYYGTPGSLNPNPQKKGRPRKSIVLVFRSDRFKDPNFLPGWLEYPHPRAESTPPPRVAVPMRKVEALAPANPPSEQAHVPILTQPEVPSVLRTPSQAAHSPTVAQPSPGAGHEKDSDSITVQDNTTNATSQGMGALEHKVLLPPKEISPSPVEKSAETLSVVTSATEAMAAPMKINKKKQHIIPNEAGMYVCEKCNGTWANENGLQYHLTKGKNLCNPFYAENPDAMQRARRINLGRYASSESATPGTPASSAANESSVASEAEISPAPARRSKEKKRKPPTKNTDRPVPKSLETTEPSSPAKPRPVLKPRSILKNRGVGGLGVVPRGVEASEAAAMRIAAEQETQDTAATSGSTANEIIVHAQNGNLAQEYWEPDEDLPYLKHIQPQVAKSSQPKSPEEANQANIDHNYDYHTVEGQQLGVSDPESASCYPPITGEAPGVSDPYPADLLDPALGATGDGDGASMNMIGAARKVLPGMRPTQSISRNFSATEAPREGGSVQRPPPSIRMPKSKYADKKDKPFSLLTERQVLTHRIQEVIQYLVASNGGVFPKDRQTLHWAVLKVFKATFSSPNGILPTQIGTIRGVGALEREKIIKTGSVAIQPDGHWKQYDIVYFPEIQIKTDAVVSHLKAQAEAVHPEMYIPFPFTPTEDEKIYFSSLEPPTNKRDQAPGRRDHKLDKEIATLNAPFYKEKGLAGVRPRFRRARLESESEEEGRPKKRSRDDTSELTIKRKKKLADNGDDDRSVKRRRGRKRRNFDEEYVILEPSKLSIDGSRTTNPGISSLPASFFSRTTVSDLEFLAPNTQLEDDYVPSTPSDFSMPEDEEGEEVQSKVPIGTCANTTELHANGRGVWLNLPNVWFEKTSGSFTMKGWMPSQSERLIEHLPKTSAEMAFRIKSHCKTDQWADPAFGAFLTSVDGCKAWELSDIGKHFMSGSIAPDYVFMNFNSTKEVSNMAPVDLQWLDENEWTLQTIPYEQLEDFDDDLYLQYDMSVIKPPKRGPGRPPKPKPEGPPLRKYQKRSPRDPTVRELKVQRELNAYPTTKSDYFRSKGEESLGIDWKAEDTRIAAYVAVSTLTGGINKAMDWGLMMRLFPEAKLSNLRKFWSMIKKEREGFIHGLSAKFQDEFLIAYEKGEHGSFDFDEPLKYDWLKLVKWTLALVVRESIELPLSRVKFEDELELIHVDKNEFDWRETYHHWQRSVFNRFQDSTSEAASTALEVTPEVADNYKIIARSWFRALCCTDPEQYSPYEIRDKFKGLVREGHLTEQEVSDLLEATIFDLEHRRIAIKSKSKALTTGRPYRLNEHFSRTLDRYANEVKFSVAADFKLKLDQAFKKGQTVDIPWRTEDGMILAAFNLQAAGRVRIEPRNRPSIPFGFKPGFYESRKFPKSYYRFDLHVVPTHRYVFNEDIAILHDATLPENIPAATEDGKLPMWCDFFGTPDRARWFKMLAGVLFAYATRGAMTDEFATQALKPCFEQSEIEVVRKWGLKNGLLRELTVPGGAVTVTEWWWLVLGQPLLDLAPAPTLDEGKDDTIRAGGRRTKDQYEEWNSGRSRRRGKYRML
ncbi:hypothetical protein N0V93_006522 [Gnomoniopsis smithogilvyi]|uniref:Uncharacterized protein n=1 Tax=Gnomoniopsis smithogilvyi TaxID=1191159 RepID=A0A9W9CVQ0_9PEZI|nr:hypothetical protein N0V93_006522 [Gnomoniopsis smithogilvyi]